MTNFEDAFDKLRRAGDIVLLIVADGIRLSVERLVHWMTTIVGYAPYKLGLIELRLYDLPDVGRIIVPRTLLRTREASRHVVNINLQGTDRNQATVTVTESGGQAGTRTIAPPGTPLTEERLTELIRSKNPPEIADVAEQLRERLKASGLVSRFFPSEIIYGVEVDGDFSSLIHVCTRSIYLLIPMRGVRVLGEERFLDCKRKINKVANFYLPSQLEDPTKNTYLMVRFGILRDKIEEFMSAALDIADTIRAALEEAALQASPPEAMVLQSV